MKSGTLSIPQDRQHTNRIRRATPASKAAILVHQTALGGSVRAQPRQRQRAPRPAGSSLSCSTCPVCGQKHSSKVSSCLIYRAGRSCRLHTSQRQQLAAARAEAAKCVASCLSPCSSCMCTAASYTYLYTHILVCWQIPLNFCLYNHTNTYGKCTYTHIHTLKMDTFLLSTVQT
jgi:hypothetical protein